MRPDVLVVGGGLAGLSAAWHLSKQARVLVLEQGDALGCEASAQNAGMQRRLAHGRAEQILANRSNVFYRSPPPGFEGVSRQVGGVVCNVHPESPSLSDAAALCAAERVSLRDVAPLAAHTDVHEAWYLPDELVLDAHTLVHAFARGARARGAEIRTGVQVHALRRSNGRVVGVETSEGPIEAEITLIATAAWSPRLLLVQAVPLRRHLLQTRPMGLASGHPYVWLDDVGVYARPEGGGFLLSACDEVRDPIPSGPGTRGPLSIEARAWAEHKLCQWFTALPHGVIAGGWSGLRTFAPDRAPILGLDANQPGVAWATGLGGFGVTTAPAVGEAVATMILGGGGWVDELAPLVDPRRKMSGSLPTGTLPWAALLDET